MGTVVMRHSWWQWFFGSWLLATIAAGCGEEELTGSDDGSGGRGGSGSHSAGESGTAGEGSAGEATSPGGEGGSGEGGETSGGGGAGGVDQLPDSDPIEWGEPGVPSEVIVYVVPKILGGDYEEKLGIWIARTDGSERHHLFEGSSPSLSPDGSRLTYTFDDSVWVSKSDGSERERVTEGSYSCWSEDGESLAVNVSGDTWVQTTPGSNEAAPIAADDVGNICRPSHLSPDGTRVARISNLSHLIVEDLDGSNPRELVNNYDSGGDCGIEGAFWSSDGAHVLVTQDCADIDYSTLKICVLDAESETAETVDYLPKLIEPGSDGFWGKYAP
jgi:Tol biopolymer transport system component